MSTYGRNFEFRVPPNSGQREGRWAIAAGTNIALGAPVIQDLVTAPGSLGVPLVKLATGATAKAGGNRGVLVYEYGPNAFAGDDMHLVGYSDKDVAPGGAAVQVVHGVDVKVVFRNTVARTFLQTRAYPGRLMVAPAGLAGIAAGDFLTPGVGTDAGGYWAETITEANAWFVVTSVDTIRAEVEARMLF